jgi:LysM repeat protein
MTDIYVRSSGGPRRGLWILLIVAAAVSVGLFWRTCVPPPQATNDPQPPVSAVEQTASVDAPTTVDLQAIEDLIATGALREARDQAFLLREQTPDPVARREVDRLLGDLHTRMVFSKAPLQEKVWHTVRAGDTLGKLANQYDSTVDSISAINQLQNNLIRVGDRLQILTGTFRCVVHKTRNEMEVTLNHRFFKRYLVGTGTDSSTPEGEYLITLRLRNPIWYRPDGATIPYGDPENLLGTHYLKLNVSGIGLHGTWEPESVGSQSSAGCVRLVNQDIEELYHLLPEGTVVIITDG